MLPESHVCFHCEDEKLQRLFDEAERNCTKNLRYFGKDLVLVEGGGYEKIWIETQPMGGEMYAGRNMLAALNNTRLFIDYQREDGRLPGCIGLTKEGQLTPFYSHFQGFCFPRPALNLYYLMGRDDAYLTRLKECLEKYDAYLWRTRDTDGDGCLESYCRYDTGEDNAARYADAPNAWGDDAPPADCQVVPMASMDFMSYSYAARDTLRAISAIQNDGREALWQEKAQDVARALHARLWDEARGACFDRDKNGNSIPILVHNNLRCMHWGAFSQDMADRFIREHLLNPKEFFTPMPLPSVAVNDPMFRNVPTNDWSGQSEGLTYQRAIAALENYGYDALVPLFGRKLFDAVINGGYAFVQQYDPFTAAPSCAVPGKTGYGPTSLAVLEYIAHMYGVHLQMGDVWLSAVSGLAYTYEQVFGEHSYAVESDGKKAKLSLDGRECAVIDCGQRLILDEQGQIKRRVCLEYKGRSHA